MQNSDIYPAFEENNIPVVIASSNMYAPYAGVFIQSLIDYVNDTKNYDVIIFERGISAENKRLLKSYESGRTNISIRFYNPSPLFLDYNILERDFPLESYYSIIAPHIMMRYKRIITANIDMLLKTDIATLLEVDLAGSCLGGVYDMFVPGFCLNDVSLDRGRITAKDHFQKVCGLENIQYYINGGLLVFDCEKYIQRLSVRTLLDTAQRQQFLFVDQDTLNYLLKGEIAPIDYAWNIMIPCNARTAADVRAGDQKLHGAYTRATKTPYLLHWAGKPKPWVCPDVPYGNEWWDVAKRTPFMGHIIARMIDELQKRGEYYKNRYGQNVAVWNPMPNVDRSKKQS